MRKLLTFLLIGIQTFCFAQRYGVVIHEIFADPSPSVGLPNSEWIEIQNRSASAVSLQGWRLTDASGSSAPFPNISLPPDSLLILCGNTAQNLLSGYGRCVGLSGFPSLDNEGELLVLRNALGQVVHAIEYANQWHTNALKKEGGWSLEMIDPGHPGIFELNWASSTNPIGGTPGKANSIARKLEDLQPPRILNTYSIDSTCILIQYDEALDSTRIGQEGIFHLSDDRIVTEARCLPPLYDRLELRTDWPLVSEKTYTLNCRGAVDLAGNRAIASQMVRIGIPNTPDSSDIRINEILFDPPNGGSDYVELLNRGKKVIDLSRLQIGSRSNNGNLTSSRRVQTSPLYFFPGDHWVLSADPMSIMNNYFVQQPDRLIGTTALPSLPDEEGSLVVLNEQGKIMDELKYSADWHFPLLQTKMGIALERIDPEGKTQERSNWQSASSTVGYGTPTRRNSQYRLFGSERMIELSSQVLSPDGDGRDDIIQIRLRLEESAMRLRIRIFHASGAPVRELANQALAGTEALFHWDGLDDRGRRLPDGQYILITEMNDKNNTRSTSKKLVTLVNRSRIP